MKASLLSTILSCLLLIAYLHQVNATVIEQDKHLAELIDIIVATRDYCIKDCDKAFVTCEKHCPGQINTQTGIDPKRKHEYTNCQDQCFDTLKSCRASCE